MQLTLTKWERYYPDIGNNRALPAEQRVFLEVERGLSIRSRSAFYSEVNAALKAEQTEGLPSLSHRLAAVLSMHVKYGTEPLRHEEGEVVDLEGYVSLALEMGNRGQRGPFGDLITLVGKANSFTQEDADFFERPSGTAPGTSGGLSPATV